MSAPIDFFRFARERHQIYLERQAGRPFPWTTDPVLQHYRFTNVYRELDVTTVWFNQWVRAPLRSSPDVLLATVLFRWFNRIRTGDTIFRQLSIWPELGMLGALTAWDVFLKRGDTALLKQSIRTFCGAGPYVTGAYIIKTPDGMDKLTGVLKCVEWFTEKKFKIGTAITPITQREAAGFMLKYDGALSLKSVWDWLRQFPYLGDFMAYEIVSDLRHTALLDQAPDIMTWANPGPGARRGLNRVHGRELRKRVSMDQLMDEMRHLLELSKNAQHWPQKWPAWEMREVEHTLCEFDKYERVRLGQGRPRGVFRHR